VARARDQGLGSADTRSETTWCRSGATPRPSVPKLWFAASRAGSDPPGSAGDPLRNHMVSGQARPDLRRQDTAAICEPVARDLPERALSTASSFQPVGAELPWHSHHMLSTVEF
jgi:hypothetical protein